MVRHMVPLQEQQALAPKDYVDGDPAKGVVPKSVAYEAPLTGACATRQPTWRRKPQCVSTGPWGHAEVVVPGGHGVDASRWAHDFARDTRQNYATSQLHTCKPTCFKTLTSGGKRCRFRFHHIFHTHEYHQRKMNRWKCPAGKDCRFHKKVPAAGGMCVQYERGHVLLHAPSLWRALQDRPRQRAGPV